jgi:hypothetical protein
MVSATLNKGQYHSDSMRANVPADAAHLLAALLIPVKRLLV